jgi:hypothetical protein
MIKRERIIIVFLCVAVFALQAVTALAAGICIQDDLGEKIHLKVYPNGQLVGYSEFDGTVTGTAFGSYKRISDHEINVGW